MEEKKCTYCKKRKVKYICESYDNIKNTNGEIIDTIIDTDYLCFYCKKKYHWYYSLIVKI